MNLNLKIDAISSHRNGVCGEPFTVVLFRDEDLHPLNNRMVATIFDTDGHCAVLNVGELNRGNVGFAQGNSWRGDRYFEALKPFVDAYNKDDSDEFKAPDADELI